MEDNLEYRDRHYIQPGMHHADHVQHMSWGISSIALVDTSLTYLAATDEVTLKMIGALPIAPVCHSKQYSVAMHTKYGSRELLYNLGHLSQLVNNPFELTV